MALFCRAVGIRIMSESHIGGFHRPVQKLDDTVILFSRLTQGKTKCKRIPYSVRSGGAGTEGWISERIEHLIRHPPRGRSVDATFSSRRRLWRIPYSVRPAVSGACFPLRGKWPQADRGAFPPQGEGGPLAVNEVPRANKGAAFAAPSHFTASPLTGRPVPRFPRPR